MIIEDAKVEFYKYPMSHCIDVKDKIKGLIGMKVDNDFIPNARKKLMGPYGCSNLITLLCIAVPGIIYYYYPYQIKKGKMTHGEWDNMVVTDLKNACIGHTLFKK